jgi:peptide deformylase
MALRSISRMGHPVLREKAREVTREELLSPDIQRLIFDMVDTMRDAPGVGLAAPQVYEGLRIIVIEVNSSSEEDQAIPLLILANPVMAETSKEKVTDWEGCLSIPDVRGLVPRHRKVTVRALNHEGRSFTVEAEGYLARILQHEMDHLDGVLFLDRMEDFKSLTFLKEFNRYWAEYDEEDGFEAD